MGKGMMVRGNCGSIEDGVWSRHRIGDVYTNGEKGIRESMKESGRAVTEGRETSGFWRMKRDGKGERGGGRGHPCRMLTGSSVSGLRGRSRLGIALMYRRLWWRCFGDAWVDVAASETNSRPLWRSVRSRLMRRGSPQWPLETAGGCFLSGSGRLLLFFVSLALSFFFFFCARVYVAS